MKFLFEIKQKQSYGNTIKLRRIVISLWVLISASSDYLVCQKCQLLVSKRVSNFLIGFTKF